MLTNLVDRNGKQISTGDVVRVKYVMRGDRDKTRRNFKGAYNYTITDDKVEYYRNYYVSNEMLGIFIRYMKTGYPLTERFIAEHEVEVIGNLKDGGGKLLYK